MIIARIPGLAWLGSMIGENSSADWGKSGAIKGNQLEYLMECRGEISLFIPQEFIVTPVGLGIRSLVFRANRSFFDKKEQIAPSLFLKE